jgi:photosystem II stability/assembly factor-like uncharacterized protein
MSGRTLLMIGTRKGLWLAQSDTSRTAWEVWRADEEMSDVHSVAIDTRPAQPRIFASNRSWHWGPQIRRSDDLGKTWQTTPGGEVVFPEDTGTSLEAVWSIAPSASEPNVVWAGTEPSALFRSEDGGETFTLMRGLWDHPHREQWAPGNGGQAIHTLLPRPDDPNKITVAMSTGGVYRSGDAGATWAPANTGIKAEFMPDEVSYPEFGQCVHKVARSAATYNTLYAQNHGGVYRTDDAGETWTSIAEGLPSEFGFPIVTHPHSDGTVWLFPLSGADGRFPPDARCMVWRSRDKGETWEGVGFGLPANGFYSAVMRDAMCTDDHEVAGVYFGSRDGTVFGSNDEGDTWNLIAEHLPDILCIRAAGI